MSDIRPAGGAGGISSGSFATPAIALGLSAAAGVSGKTIRSDATIAAFNASAASASAVGDVAAAGSVNFAARVDHVHGREAFSGATPATTSAAGAVGSAATLSHSDHAHPHGTGYTADAHPYTTVSGWTTLLQSGATSTWGSTATFFRDTAGGNAQAAALYVKALQSSGGGTSVTPLVGAYMTADVTGGTFSGSDHAIGGLGYLVAGSGSTVGAGFYGLEGRVDMSQDKTGTPQGFGVLGLGSFTVNNPTNLQGLTGVTGRIEMGSGVTGAATQIAIGGRFSVVRAAGSVGSALAWNAIFGDDNENVRTTFRGAIQGSSNDFEYTVTDSATVAKRGLKIFMAGAQSSAFRYVLRDTAGASAFQVENSSEALQFSVSSAGVTTPLIINFPAVSAPASPAAGKYMYLDTADSKIKVKNASGVVQLLEEQLASAMLFPIAWMGAAGTATATNFASNSSYFVYMGKAQSALTTCDLVVNVLTAAATITWAEVGVFTGTVNANGASGTLTRVGFTDVSATYNSTGVKKTTIALSGVNPGDDLWIALGSQATTPYQVMGGFAEVLQTGAYQVRASTRISTATAAAGALVANTIIVPFIRLKV